MSQPKTPVADSKWVRTVDFVLNHRTKIMVGCGTVFVTLAAMGAKAAYDISKEKEAQRFRSLLRDSEHAMKARDYAGQVQCLTAVLALQPNHIVALTNRANALCVLGRFEEALADAKAVLKQEKTPRGLMAKGRALRGLKEYKKALLAYNKVLKHADLSDVMKASVLKSIDGIEQEIRSKKANQKMSPLEQAKKDLLSSSVPQRPMSSATAASISMPSGLFSFSSSSSTASSSMLSAEEESIILRIQQQINAAQSKHEEKFADAAASSSSSPSPSPSASSSSSSAKIVDAQITVASDGSPVVSIVPAASSPSSAFSASSAEADASSSVTSEVTVSSSSTVISTPTVVMEESSILVESSEHKSEAEEDGEMAFSLTQSQIMGESGVLLSQSEVREAQEQDREQQ